MQSGMKELPIDVTQGLFGSVLDSLLDYIAGLVGRLMAHSVGEYFISLLGKRAVASCQSKVAAVSKLY